MLTPYHRQNHFERSRRLQGVGYVCWHHDQLAGMQTMSLAGYIDVSLSIDDLYNGVEGSFMLTESLPIIEGKNGERACWCAR